MDRLASAIRMPARLTGICAGAALALCLPGCSADGASGSATAGEDSRPKIAVTTAPLAWAAKALAGDSLDVLTLLPPGADPESYEPSLRTMRDLANSDALFHMATPGFESAVASSVGANFPNLPIIPLTSGISPIYGHHHHEEEDGHEDHHDHDSVDPHYLTSPGNMSRVVGNMARALANLHPERAAVYRHRADSLSEVISTLDRRIAALTGTADSIGATRGKRAENGENHSFATMHPSLSYFARDYGLTQVSLGEEVREISPRDYQERLAQARRADIFVAETTHDPSRSAEVARQAGLTVITLDLNSEDWQSQLLKLAEALHREEDFITDK